ncbi:MAG: hypothetical protein KAU02_01610 [Tenericutes bacterium]|nr:hypothetical protein [Mycoplasmatota bacterium]
MISSQDWWNVIRNYGQSIYPTQIIVMIIGIVAVIFLLFGSKTKSNMLMKAYLGLCNLWIGGGFFIILGKGFPSPLKQIQGMLFIAIGILFIVDIFTEKSDLTFHKCGLRKWATIGFLLIVFCYPLLGIIFGRSIDELIFPGTFPCATAALALILLTNSHRKVNIPLYILLLIWAIPFPPLIQIPQFHVYEDSIMFVIGIYALTVFIVSAIRSRKTIYLNNKKNESLNIE